MPSEQPATPAPAPTGPSFKDLALDPRLLAAVETLGYEEPTPIQREAIPLLLAGRDLLGQAETGTGKTAAFALPLLQRIGAHPPDGVRKTRALILVPTRELAMQVTEAVHRYGKGIGARVLPVYGGQPIERQLRALKTGVDVVVGTPGRIMDHMRRRTLALEHLEVVVLDEADEMLDMGFADDIEAILKATPATRQTALFSATMPPRIEAIAQRHLRQPLRLKIATRVSPTELGKVRQTAYIVSRSHKIAALVRILDVERPTATLVFCRTRLEVDDLVEALTARGYQAEALHGGMSQEQRDRALKKLRGGQTELLVATDVAARGLDIDHLSHVVNYDVPSAPEAYVHRIGRTGRAGREGVAITLAEPREQRLLRNIEGLTRRKIIIATVPTVADLHARRLEQTTASLRETLVTREAGELEPFRSVVEALKADFDIFEVAMAAVKVIHLANGGDQDDLEIPTAAPPKPKFAGSGKAAPGAPSVWGTKPAPSVPGAAKSGGHWQQPAGGPALGQATATAIATAMAPRGKIAAYGAKAPGPEPTPFDPKAEGGYRAKKEKDKKARKPAYKTAKLFIGAGAEAGIRPADLVGAIVNETGLEPAAIGAIEIGDRFSLVVLPEDVINDLVPMLQKVKLKGKKVEFRRDRA